jgi:2-aminoethylphosphonate transport system substrate-binding protein
VFVVKFRLITGAAAACALTVTLAACGGTSATGSGGSTGSTGGAAGSGQVTVYSADGLGDWYKTQFAAFTRQTGIKVDYVEAGSSEVVSRVEKERSNPQDDVLVTLPPFIQQADKDGVLAPLGVDTSAIASADKASDGHWAALVNNYSCFIYNNKQHPPRTWDDLLSADYKGKLQYSTPGQAGDGTAVLVLLEHEMGKPGALAYLKRLQANNVGPSSSTGGLQPKVSSGSLLAANGDMQMNLQSIQADKSNFTVIFPSDGTKKPETLAIPYDISLTANAPHAANGTKLIDFLLSEQVQRTVSSGAFGFPVRTDVHPTDANYHQLQQALRGVTVYHPDWDTVLGSLDADVAAYDSATGS